VWIGAREGTEEVKDIYNKINYKLKSFNFKKEKFKSHITISRVKYFDYSDRSKFIKLMNDFNEKDFGTLNISSFQFKKSKLTPKGPIYTNIKEITMD